MDNLIKKVCGIVICTILIHIVFYFINAFIFVDFDITAWTMTAMSFQGIVGTVIGIFLGSIIKKHG